MKEINANTDVTNIYRVSQRNHGAFVGLSHCIEPLDPHEILPERRLSPGAVCNSFTFYDSICQRWLLPVRGGASPEKVGWTRCRTDC